MAFPRWLQEMAAYINNPHIYMYGMWDSPTPGDVNGPYGPGVPGEGGVDLGAPQGTPVYALASGPVIGSGYWKDKLHGVVTTRVNVPGVGSEDLYYQHINIAPGIHQGGYVQKGQQIGTVGSLNEVEVGFNANWGYPWQSGKHPGPWIKDPREWIKALMLDTSTVPPPPTSGPGSTQTNQLNSNNLMQDTNNSNPLDVTSGLTDWLNSVKAGVVSASWHFVDAALLFILGITLLIVGGMLILNRGVSVPPTGV